MCEFALMDPNPFAHIPAGNGLYLFEAKFPFSTMAELETFGQKSGPPHSECIFPDRIAT